MPRWTTSRHFVCSAQREYAQQALARVQESLRSVGTERKEARREAVLTEAITQLKRMYPNGEWF
jgi:hypothetical protein